MKIANYNGEFQPIVLFRCTHCNVIITLGCRISKSIVFKQNYAKINVNRCHLSITREELCFCLESTCVNIYYTIKQHC